MSAHPNDADPPTDAVHGSTPEGAEDEAVFVVPIEEAFDLHHFRPSEILEVVDAYLDAALEAGLREVRLIHGRGKGVQRARVRDFLDSDPRVERYMEAPPGRGGWGATLAWLRPPAPDGGESPRAGAAPGEEEA